MVGFNGIVDIGRIFLDNKRKINRWNGVVSRFKSKSTKMIKDL